MNDVISPTGWNGGYPYGLKNKKELGLLGKGNRTFLVNQEGYLPPIITAIGTASFGYRPREPIYSFQNRGIGYGQKIKTADINKRSTLPKEYKYYIDKGYSYGEAMKMIMEKNNQLWALEKPTASWTINKAYKSPLLYGYRKNL